MNHAEYQKHIRLHPLTKEQHARIAENARRRYREPENYRRYLVRARISHAITAGMLFPQPCEVCGRKKSEAHHDDYSKPYDVRWFCRKHHRELHLKKS